LAQHRGKQKRREKLKRRRKAQKAVVVRRQRQLVARRHLSGEHGGGAPFSDPTEEQLQERDAYEADPPFDEELAEVMEQEALYDAELMPNAEAWLAADESERQIAVEYFHWREPRPHELAPNPRLHAILHAVIETQIASDDPPEARQTLLRLTGEGLTRHDAVHAMATVLTEFIFEQRWDEVEYVAKLGELSREGFLGLAEEVATTSGPHARARKGRRER
jgi:hypothetical protein